MARKSLFIGAIAWGVFITFFVSLIMLSTAAQARELKFSHYLPITHPASKALEEWAADIKTKTNGAISIKIFPSSQLFQTTENFDAVSEGAADLAFNGLFGEVGKKPAFALFNLPYIFPSFESSMQNCRGALQDLFDKEANTLNVKVVSVAFVDYAQWFTTKKALKTPADFKGVRLRVFPGYVSDAVEIMGGAAVMMPSSDVYTALQNGVVEGHIGTLASTISSKYYEVEKFGVVGPFNLSPIHVIANLKMWNGLKPEEQKLMTQSLNEMADKLMLVFKELTLTKGPEQLKEKGMAVHIQTLEEINQFKEVLKPVYEKYLKLAGENGKKALESVK